MGDVREGNFSTWGLVSTKKSRRADALIRNGALSGKNCQDNKRTRK